MHETIAADGDADVRHVAAFSHEEHEIPRRNGGGIDRMARRPLVSDDARAAAGGGLVSEQEDIKLVTSGLDEFLARVAGGGFVDAKTIVAGYWLKDNLARLAPG